MTALRQALGGALHRGSEVAGLCARAEVEQEVSPELPVVAGAEDRLLDAVDDGRGELSAAEAHAAPHVRATAYGAALACDRPAARAFIDYLATSPAREALSASGFMPQ